MGETSVFETISREYYSLTASEKKTADYLMAHQEESQYMSIADLAEESGIEKFYIHCYLDGRDVPPRCAVQYIQEIEQKLAGTHGRIATVHGRYYAMDRDKRWEREQLAYDAMTLGKGFTVDNAEKAVTDAYARDENDEFVKNLSKHSTNPYTKWWLEQEPYTFLGGK